MTVKTTPLSSACITDSGGFERSFSNQPATLYLFLCNAVLRPTSHCAFKCSIAHQPASHQTERRVNHSRYGAKLDQKEHAETIENLKDMLFLERDIVPEEFLSSVYTHVSHTVSLIVMSIRGHNQPEVDSFGRAAHPALSISSPSLFFPSFSVISSTALIKS